MQETQAIERVRLDSLYPPSWFGHDEVAMRVADSERHERLRKVLSVPTSRYLWVPEDAVEFTPPLSDVVYGDGRALLSFTTLSDRPRFWFIRIDSRWDIGMEGPPHAPYFAEYVDWIGENLALEFGDGDPDEEEEDEHDDGDPFPAIALTGGCSWNRHSWPAKVSPVERHPHCPHLTTIAAEPRKEAT